MIGAPEISREELTHADKRNPSALIVSLREKAGRPQKLPLLLNGVYLSY